MIGFRVGLLITLSFLLGCPNLPLLTQDNATCSNCNIILISIDTLRQDVLGVYGGTPSVSPQIDAFARSATVYDEYYAVSPYTAPAHTSMFTGLSPIAHNVCNIGTGAVGRCKPLPQSVETLASFFRRKGYQTSAIHNHGNLAGQVGLERGFDEFEGVSTPQIFFKAVEKVAQFEETKKPFFLFIHTYQAHDPYLTEHRYASKFEDPPYQGNIVGEESKFRELVRSFNIKKGVAADQFDWNDWHKIFWDRVKIKEQQEIKYLFQLYQGAVNKVDDQIGHFFKGISGALKNTVVIITSDHGEEFGEHGQFVHQQVFREVTKIPLVIRHPQIKKLTRVNVPVSQTELACMLSKAVGAVPPTQFGSCLLNSTQSEARTLFQSCPEHEKYGAFKGRGHLVVDGRFGPNRNSQQEVFYFDHRTDPFEKNNLWPKSEEAQALYQELRQHVVEQMQEARELKKADMHQETRELPISTPTLLPNHMRQLKALGYL